MGALILFAVLFVLMWFLLIAPQRRRIQRQQVLIQSLNVGDEIVTGAGIVGRIVDLDPEFATVEIAPGVKVRMLKLAVNRKLNDDATANSDEQQVTLDANTDGENE
jgi:preprotein translocase subunit YajC